MEEVLKNRCEIEKICELCQHIIKNGEDEFIIRDEFSTNSYVLCEKCFEYKTQSQNKKLLTYFNWTRDKEMDIEYVGSV